jgi:glyoxylase-like metal-dependent hydrolase (beta-lactamase superfamily II)
VEVAAGIHRIESALGERFMAQYLLVGEERTLLVDTGLPQTPAEAIVPYLESIDRSVEAIDEVLTSHADLDHSGGNRALRDLQPGARFSCHELDRRWIESNEAMVAENYLWHEPYGFDEPDEAGRAELRALCGGDSTVDLGLRGGETLRLERGWRVELVHLPGHTPGHLGVWDPRSRAAIVVDAVLERGVSGRAGNLLIPPRIYDVGAYRRTIATIRALEPELLLTSHFRVLDAEEARRFLADSAVFLDDVAREVEAGLTRGVTGLRDLTLLVNEALGPYPEFTNELAATVRASG